MLNVRALQRKLKKLNYKIGSIDGVMGPRTRNAWELWTSKLLKLPVPKAVSSKHGVGPAWYLEALAQKGLHERQNYSRLRSWFHKSVAWIDPRKIAWCGAFVQTCIRLTVPDEDTPDNPLGARNWARFGVGLKQPALGAVLVFWRGSRKGWKGHVGFYAGEDATTYHALGGNQSNAVTISRVRKNRLLAIRWPKSAELPQSGKIKRTSKSKISTNE
ncbi:MAG: TIGR02594 family protein, partial [Phycisphaerales bacterium]|nr:TIGR02594 family protein [Phycisphaerales bacterium]